MAKFYIATKLTRVKDHNLLRDHLQSLGHEITYDWTTHGNQKRTSKERLNEIAELEAKGVQEADVLIVLLPGGRGTHTELGMGLALQKPVVIHTEQQAPFELCEETCAFYWCNNVIRHNCTMNELLSRIYQTFEDLSTLASSRTT